MGLLITNIIQNIKSWWRGEEINIITSLYCGTRYERPLIAKAILGILGFWNNHWHILFPTITAAFVALYIHFSTCPNSSNETEQKENHQPASTNHVKPSQ